LSTWKEKLLNVPTVAHSPRRVLEQQLLLCRRHISEQVAGLLPMVIVDAVVPVRCVPFERERRLGKIGLVVPEPLTVGIVSERSAQIALGAHLAVAVVALERAHRCVDGDVVEVDAEPVALGVAIGEQPSLEHLVRRKADTGHDGGVQRRIPEGNALADGLGAGLQPVEDLPGTLVSGGYNSGRRSIKSRAEMLAGFRHAILFQ
jgi:hypothetical protein